MNELINKTTTGLTMSSKEIAELCEKQHKDVMRDIRNMLGQLELSEKGYAQNCADPQNGQLYPVFTLPKDLTLTLVSGYSVKLRKRIIDRWLELEEKARNPIAALSRVDLLKLALDSEEKRLELESKVIVLEPKARALDRLADANGLMNCTVAAKTLQVPPKKLFDWMRSKHWIYRRPGGAGNVAYQDKIAAGLLTHKVTVVHRDDGSEKVVEQVLITGKGLAQLSNALNLH